jgi:C-terminal processing protease CtpA/Prc
VVDPVSGDAVEAMRVARVIEGHAAQRAGMKVGDLIVSYDNEAMGDIYEMDLPDQPDPKKLAKQQGRAIRTTPREIEAFTHRVKTSEPGRELAIRVLRPVPTGKELIGKMNSTPREFRKSFRYVGSNEGFVVRHVDADSPAAGIGLKVDDIITKVNGQKVSSDKADQPIEGELEKIKLEGQFVLSVIRPVLKEVHLTVVLGKRPMDMINTNDELVLRDRFAQWWLKQEGEIVYPPSSSGTRWVYPVTTEPAPETDLLP